MEPPALHQGLLRLGAKVLGAPAWDPDFNTADLPMLMRIDDLPARYRKHFRAHETSGRPARDTGRPSCRRTGRAVESRHVDGVTGKSRKCHKPA